MARPTTMLRVVRSEVTWEDIERMRAERLPPFVVRAQKVQALASRPDPRLPGNTAAHVQRQPSAKELGAKMTPARAAKLRRLSMEACPCRLCALALRPPLTFADAERFAYGAPDAWPPTRPMREGKVSTARGHLAVADLDPTHTMRDEP